MSGPDLERCVKRERKEENGGSCLVIVFWEFDVLNIWRAWFLHVHVGHTFLSATEYHSGADYNSRRVGVVVVVVVVIVVHNFKNGLTFERLDRFASYLGGSCTGVRRFRAYACVLIRPPKPAQPAYHPKSEKRGIFKPIWLKLGM